MFAVLEGSRRRGGGEGQDAQLAASLKLARLLGGRGNPEAALEIAEKLKVRHAGDPDVICLRGQCFAALDGRRAQVGIAPRGR